jgi:hypothetical protein
MIKSFILAVVLCCLFSTGYSQQSDIWSGWKWLAGSWTGEGSGQPGQGGGTFSFNYDLDRNILIRKSHSVYPASGDKPEIIHNDLMIIYPVDKKTYKAIYFDNEGHTINYSVILQNNSITLTSDKLPGSPVFRLTYTLLKDNLIDTKFEISQDGTNFSTYVEGKSKRQ